jgi:uncharacterized protein
MTSSTGNPFAVVTGASSGIGAELARQFATHDFDLLVAADDYAIHGAEEHLAVLGANVEAVQVDLAAADGVQRLYAATDRPIDALCLTAGAARGAQEHGCDAARERVTSHSAATEVRGRFSRALPDRLKAVMHRKMAEPGSARR